MRVATYLFLFVLCFTTLSPSGASIEVRNSAGKGMQGNTIKIKVKDGRTFLAKLEDNSSSKALKELLLKGEISIRMQDYANMEKVGPIGTGLPRNDNPTTTTPGDLILYQGKYFVIYYAPNSWNFTRLGKIEGVDGKNLKSALGEGDVVITLSVD